MNYSRPEERLFRPAVLMVSQFDAALFDLDGVVTGTARMHAAAWTQTFDSLPDREPRRSVPSWLVVVCRCRKAACPMDRNETLSTG